MNGVTEQYNLTIMATHKTGESYLNREVIPLHGLASYSLWDHVELDKGDSAMYCLVLKQYLIGTPTRLPQTNKIRPC